MLKKIFFNLKSIVFGNENYSKKNSVIPNVFKSDFNKKALLSYIKPVFETSDAKQSKYHTNHHTTTILADVLHELGFSVDVINHDECINDTFNNYDLILGLGKSLDYVLQHRGKNNPKVVWFGTGCNPFFSNPVTIKRISDFKSKHGKLLMKSSRYIYQDDPLQHEISDFIILHGGSFSKSTYRNTDIETVNAPVFICHKLKKTLLNFETNKNNYLWFGGGGAIHKGLDLLIDAFKDIKNCNLHICGKLESENDFLNYYQSTIDTSVNIFYHGFVAIETEQFKSLLNLCTFIIYPSASEANCAAVITCMANGGLIPIITTNTDIDLKNYGIIIKDLTVVEVLNSVNKSQEFTVDELKNQSEMILKFTNEVNTFDYFKRDFKQKLADIL